jgi:hypothetical protein
LAAAGDLIRTGPTNTNVADLMLMLCDAPGRARPGRVREDWFQRPANNVVRDLKTH